VVVAWQSGTHGLAFPIIGVAVCFAIRLAGLYREIDVPTAPQAPGRTLRSMFRRD
jgi:hypothetical protein